MKTLGQTIRHIARKVGIEAVYRVLVMYYAIFSQSTRLFDKAFILGGISYILLPMDLIPDSIPIFGYSDDLAALFSSFDRISRNIRQETKEWARAKVNKWFSTDV